MREMAPNGGYSKPRKLWGYSRIAVWMIAPLTSGVGTALCIRNDTLWWLLWFVLVPYGLAVPFEKGFTTRLGFFLGGFICMLMGLDFVRTAFEGELFWSWVALSMVVAVFWILIAAVARLICAEFVLPMSFVLPLSWVAFEFARTHFVAAIVGAPFSYMQLGTAAIECRQLIQIADIGGIYAVTWVIVMINGAIVDMVDVWRKPTEWQVERNSTFSIGYVVVVLAAAWFYGAWRLSHAVPERGPLIALVPGSLRQSVQNGGIESITRRGAIADQLGFNTSQSELDRDNPVLYVWGEGAYGLIEVGPETSSHVMPLEELSKVLRAAVLTGCERAGTIPGTSIGARYNSVAYVTPRAGFQGCYDKVYLAPGREYFPPVATAFELLPPPPSGGPTGPFSAGNDRRAFTLTTSKGTYRFAATICAEISCAIHHCRFLTDLEAGTDIDFFIGCASESAFCGPLYSEYSARAQRMRSIECRRSFGRIAQDGLSAFVDSNGDILQARWTDGDSEALVHPIPIDHRFSLYAHCGDWLPVASCVTLGVVAAVAIRRSRRHANARS